MGVVAARLVFLAFVGLTGAIIYNALYLQDLPGSNLAKAVPKTSASPLDAAALPPVSTDLPPLDVEQGGQQLLVRAVQRELAARGYDVGPEDGTLRDKTKAAIETYQGGHGLPVTGAPSDELLRHILLGDSPAEGSATGALRDVTAAGATRGKDQSNDVRAVQQVLADLGYAPGKVDGAFGEATKRAILTFQRDRKIAQTGKITPDLLAELKRVTGRDVTRLAAER
jgi:peptidoglycan hydrolase-like protein with peptidoglycan-binding domain